ncbi:hypothetical protein MBEBAB_0864 [Brevundimonas abyssalis TAR-001]|uniref:Uncharacterized protein n=2 Tax=Brevundimonas TaxID=41275 RepID=A0A8E0KL70_9CAUL|nr:hypothetical protein MBEBAB_0864 [Brevundimonas abyssalis TAR-001]
MTIELVNPGRPRPDWGHVMSFGEERREFVNAYDVVTRLQLPLFSAVHRALHPQGPTA